MDSLVIVPTFNEKDNIEALIHQVFSLSKDFHILIIDDNSPDGTPDIIKSLQKSYREALHLLERPGKQGLGTAYIQGFQWALERDYEYIFEMDADFSHNPKDLPTLYEACRNQQADVVVGSRYVKGVNVVNWPMSRVLLSFLASKYVNFITGIPVKDTTAGFVCYHRDVLEIIDLNKIKFKGYAFQIEMKFMAWKHGFQIVEEPIIFTDRSKGESKMSKGIFREAFLGVIEMKIKSFFRSFTPQKGQIPTQKEA